MFSDIRGWAAAACAAVVGFGAAAADAEVISWEMNSAEVLPDQTTSGLVKLSDSTTALFGYSLAIEVTPIGGATGTLAVDLALTNFFDARNLITAAGSERDPVFSIILPTSDGAFISTNTADFSGVTAATGVNDVLAQVFFRASANATGSFEVRLATGTALSDTQGFPVDFSSSPIAIRVVPSPGVAVMMLPVALMRRRRRHD